MRKILWIIVLSFMLASCDSNPTGALNAAQATATAATANIRGTTAAKNARVQQTAAAEAFSITATAKADIQLTQVAQSTIQHAQDGVAVAQANATAGAVNAQSTREYGILHLEQTAVPARATTDANFYALAQELAISEQHLINQQVAAQIAADNEALATKAWMRSTLYPSLLILFVSLACAGIVYLLAPRVRPLTSYNTSAGTVAVTASGFQQAFHRAPASARPQPAQ